MFLISMSQASRPVDSKLCGGPVPNTSQLCHILCPIECEVSPWGAWGPCTYENCDVQEGKKGVWISLRVGLSYVDHTLFG